MGISETWRRLTRLFHKEEFARELDEEMRLHVELRERKLRDQGLDPQSARYAALRHFGNRTVLHESSTETWGWTRPGQFAQDLRHAFRTLRKSPGFTALAVITLALGLGINVAVFSLVNGVMIRALPYPAPERLVSLWEMTGQDRPAKYNASGAGGEGRSTVSVANLVDYQKAAPAFSGMAQYEGAARNLTGLGDPVRLPGEAITPAFFEVLGVRPLMGRNFLPDENQPGAPNVVIVTHDFWQRRLGADPTVLERSVQLDGKPHRIVGVLPAGFESPAQLSVKDRIEVYTPAVLTPLLLASHGDHEVNVVARLRPGVSMETARAQLGASSASLAKQYPQSNTGVRAAIAPLDRDLVRNVTDSLMALLGASALIVLITCVNVANLFLVRAIARRHETGVRLALGAGHLRIVRQFLAESLLVTAAGAVSGILLGQALMRVLIYLAPPNLPRIQQVTMDWRVFGVATAIATLTGIVFGLAPAWQASQFRPSEALKSAARNTGDKGQARWRTLLPAIEVALSVILLIGAGLLGKSFIRLMGIDLGFQPERVLAMNLNLPTSRYPTADDRLRFFEQLEQRVQGLPGIDAVAYANRMPLRGGWGSGINLDTDPQNMVDPDFQAVSPGYFETLGIPLVRGRKLTAEDRKGRAPVAVVNQAFSKHYLSGANPIGHRLRRGTGRPWVEIVGVVNDIRRDGKAEDIKPQVYLSAAQTELYPVSLADFAIRSSQNPRRLLNAIQARIWSLDKDLPLTGVRTLEEIVSASVAQRRFQTLLLLVFAAVAVGLSVIGIYGVLSYSVSQRTRELGLRIALGANPWRIVGLVVRQAGAVIAGGVIAGLAGAWVLSSYLESLLFQVKRHDPATYLFAVGLLACVALLAALIPARRGARVDPIVALRWE